MGRKTITVVSGCFNEEANIEELVHRVFAVAAKLPEYDWDYIIVDNCSTDCSRTILRRLARVEKRLKVIFNARNFGHIRSPYHGMLQAQGHAVIYLASDLQDPPEMLEAFVRKWEEGWKVVAAVKEGSEETPLFFLIRRTYYEFIARLADVDVLRNFTGFGLYDQVVIGHLRDIADPYPYHRGIIAELGFPVAKIPFRQPLRRRGFSKNNFYTLYDIAMLGVTNHTKIPLRIATMLGFLMSAICFLIGLFYLVGKLVLWRDFAVGVAPIVVGLFFIGSVQLLFIGIVGEYIGAIHTKVTRRPLVVEVERINF